MLIVTAVVMPFALLLLLLAMERVEEPLRTEQVGRRLRGLLSADEPVEATARRPVAPGPDRAPPAAPPADAGNRPAEQLENLVRDGYGPALQRYWRRRRVLALLRREG